MQSPHAQSRSAPKPYKPRPWSHQQDLASLIGRTINIAIMDGAILSGVLRAADPFTLKIELPDSKADLTVFKHVIASYAAG